MRRPISAGAARRLDTLLHAIFFAAVTYWLGWYGVPIAAGGWAATSALLGRSVPASRFGVAAALGWAALLAWDLAGPRAGEVVGTIGGLARVAPAVGTALAAALTLALAFALAWAAATLGELAGGWWVAPVDRSAAAPGARPGPVTLPAPDAPSPAGTPARTSAAPP